MTADAQLTSPMLSLGSDPRIDPRIVAALEPFGLDGAVPEPAVTPASPRDAQLRFCARSELRLQAVLTALAGPFEPVEGVVSETTEIGRSDGSAITLHVHRPAREHHPLPCVVHLHGGAMVMLAAADPVYACWRKRVAASGAVVVGVEFRNAAGALGDHQFPAGLDDCVAAVRWTAANLLELGATHVVLAGDSGGANLALAVAIAAQRDASVGQIAGCYAQCPYIAGAWGAPPNGLASMDEFDGYFATRSLYTLFAEVYDPGAAHADDPTCWPLSASPSDLQGLPPHVISVNELDLLRDEGLEYFRMLRRAGVSAVGRMVAGTCHGADVVLAGAVPDVHEATVRDLSGFARSLAPAVVR